MGVNYNSSSSSSFISSSSSSSAAVPVVTVAVCEQASLAFLRDSSWLFVAVSWAMVVCLSLPIFILANRRGYFTEGGQGLANMTKVYKEVGTYWGRNNGWVAVRGLLNNTRTLIALTITIRMGLTQSAIFVLATDLVVY